MDSAINWEKCSQYLANKWNLSFQKSTLLSFGVFQTYPQYCTRHIWVDRYINLKVYQRWRNLPPSQLKLYHIYATKPQSKRFLKLHKNWHPPRLPAFGSGARKRDTCKHIYLLRRPDCRRIMKMSGLKEKQYFLPCFKARFCKLQRNSLIYLI